MFTWTVTTTTIFNNGFSCDRSISECKPQPDCGLSLADSLSAPHLRCRNDSMSVGTVVSTDEQTFIKPPRSCHSLGRQWISLSAIYMGNVTTENTIFISYRITLSAHSFILTPYKGTGSILIYVHNPLSFCPNFHL